ncbi:hypothetical protein [Spirosoma jeollabukense]
MLVAEAITIGIAFILLGLTYLSYVRTNRILKQVHAQRKQMDHLHRETQRRYFEAINLSQKALRARNDAYKEAEQIAAFWNAERLN